MTNSSEPRSRWQQTLRRILRGLTVIIGLIAIIAAIAPALLFSRRVELWISREATGYLGRSVVVEDVAIGWLTPLHAGRISLPPVAGEGDYPLVDIRGVSVPLTLAKIAMLPPYSLSINIEKIEFNLVKMNDGKLNVAGILSAIGGGAPAKPAAKGSGLATLPLRDVKVDIRNINIRYVDKPKSMAAGLEGGSVFLNWPGGDRPLTGKIAGKILLNETRLPWELDINLMSWINADRSLMLNSAELTVDSGGGTNAPVYLNLSMAEGHKSIAHLALPLALVTRATKALNLSPELPDLAGRLELLLNLSHDHFERLDIHSTLLFNEIKVTGTAGTQGKETPTTGTAAVGGASTNNAAGKGFDGSLGVDGKITLNAHLARPASPVLMPPPLRFQGELVTEIGSLDLTAGKIGISFCDFRDRRDFSLALDPAAPANLTYSDSAHTSLASLEGTMGVVVGKFELNAKASFAPPGVATYDIDSSDVSGITFTTPAIKAVVPPMHLSGAISANLKSSALDVKDLRFTLGQFLESKFSSFFNWTNGELRVTAGVDLSSLSNAMAIVQVPSTGVSAALPQLTGGISGSVNLHGKTPETGFKLGDPLPIAGDAQVNFIDVGVAVGRALTIRGINAVAKLGLAEDGRDIKTSLNLQIADTVAGGDKVPPLENVHLDALAVIHDFDKIQADLGNFGIESLGTSASAHMTAGGLLACMSTNTSETGAVKLLHALNLECAASFNQDLQGISGMVTNLNCGGNVGVAVTFKNSPRQSLAVTGDLNIDNLHVNWADRVRIDGVHGTLKATKTFQARGTGRRPVSPPPGRIMVDAVSLKTPKLPLEMHKMAIEFQGAEHGMTLSVAIPDMIGGPTEITGALSRLGGDPELSAKVTVTGLNGGALIPGLEFKKKEDGDINAVADVSLVLPRDPRGMLLDYLNLRVRTMRIGKSALVRIMKAMDSRQETPQFQNAITALSLGTPVGAEFALANSLVTINAELLLAGGMKVSLPVLDSAPLSDIMGVYKLDGAGQKLDDLRRLLLLLMTDDLAKLEKSIDGTPQ